MPLLWIILVLLLAFLVGGISFSYLAGRMLRGVDLRLVGSGNLGASNVYRQVGPVWGIAVFVLDLLKGYLAVILAQMILGGTLLPALAGLAAILGHSFTPYLGFRGGKGVATSAGVFLRLAPGATGLALGAFLLVLLVDRRISMGSLIAALVLPLGVLFLEKNTGYLLVFSLAVAILVWLRHRANIGRILRGEEPRFGLSKQGGER